jgi:hypothetical protein
MDDRLSKPFAGLSRPLSARNDEFGESFANPFKPSISLRLLIDEECDIDRKEVDGDMEDMPDVDRRRDINGFMGGLRGGRCRCRCCLTGEEEA